MRSAIGPNFPLSSPSSTINLELQGARFECFPTFFTDVRTGGATCLRPAAAAPPICLRACLPGRRAAPVPLGTGHLRLQGRNQEARGNVPRRWAVLQPDQEEGVVDPRHASQPPGIFGVAPNGAQSHGARSRSPASRFIDSQSERQRIRGTVSA